MFWLRLICLHARATVSQQQGKSALWSNEEVIIHWNNCFHFCNTVETAFLSFYYHFPFLPSFLPFLLPSFPLSPPNFPSLFLPSSLPLLSLSFSFFFWQLRKVYINLVFSDLWGLSSLLSPQFSFHTFLIFMWNYWKSKKWDFDNK